LRLPRVSSALVSAPELARLGSAPDEHGPALRNGGPGGGKQALGEQSHPP